MFTHVKLCDWTALTFGSEDRPDGQQAHAAPATQARAQAQARAATAPPHKAAAPAAGGPWVLAPGSEGLEPAGPLGGLPPASKRHLGR